MVPSRLSRRKRPSGTKARKPLRCACVLGICCALLIYPLTEGVLAAGADSRAPEIAEAPSSNCELNSARGDIKHAIYIQFGHFHYLRDIPNVPSDLEQMPHLLNFIQSNGVLLTNHHTALSLEPTANALTALTGFYPDHHGSTLGSGSGYWTTAEPGAVGTDPAPSQTSGGKKSISAPWVTFTRAGCNVGAVGIPKMALENGPADVLNVFGANSLEAAMFADPSTSQRAAAEMLGVAIHCALGNSVCALGKPDALPDEPGGYLGFNALFGHKNIEPVISPRKPLTDLNGQTVTDGNGNPGFPEFATITAAQTLAYVAAMQEHGVPITFAYISAAHDNHSVGGAFGPGEAGYVAQLKAYDSAFEKFVARLHANGINQNNTLFVFTADSGDHFAGGAPSPATCDGVSVPCTYAKLGAAAINLSEAFARQDSKLASVAFDSDTASSPSIFVRGNPPLDSPAVRRLQKAAAKITAIHPFTGSPDPAVSFLADSVALQLLHMLREGPRNPAFVIFGNPDYYFVGPGSSGSNQKIGTVWNHGGVAPEINTTFLALVGPGINVKGVENGIWSDHADVRPTMLALLGLKDALAGQGRALAELFQEWALPPGVRDTGEQFAQFAQAYKRINAPAGELGLTSLRISTAALADDAKFNDLLRQLGVIAALRDDMASAMANLLAASEFHGRRITTEETRQLVRSANDLTDYVKLLAANGW